MPASELLAYFAAESRPEPCSWRWPRWSPWILERQNASIDSMKRGTANQLIVRNLEDEVIRELKLRAARHGRSAEAEHREILREALLPARPTRSLKELLLAMPETGEDADFERSSDRGRDVEL